MRDVMLMFICRGTEGAGQTDLESDVQECKGRDVTKISSCWVNTTRGQPIRQLHAGIYFGNIFLLFSHESSLGPQFLLGVILTGFIRQEKEVNRV